MKIRCAILTLALLAPAARAQDAPAMTPVVFVAPGNDAEDQRLLQAIRQTLSRTPSFNLMAAVIPDALVITIPDGFGRSGREDRSSYSFTAAFFRNGDKIGESLEGCKIAVVTDCASQIAADAQSAAAVVK